MKDRILLVYSNFSTFVKQDQEILSNKYQVDTYQFKSKANMFSILFQSLKQLFYLLLNIHKYKGMVIWFCDYHTFFPALLSKMTGKKSLIIVGGFDAYSIPQLNYGLFNDNFVRRSLAKSAYRMSSSILPVDSSLIKNEIKHLSSEPIQGGITYFVKGVAKKTEALPTSFDQAKWTKPAMSKAKKSVLTVGIVNDERTYLIKGIDLFLECAKRLPDFEFRIAGLSKEYQRKLDGYQTKNLKIYGFLSDAELVKTFQETSIYAQFSRTEGLPSVVCEAMLSECIPVGTNVGGMKNLIADTGIVIDSRDVNEAVKAIKDADKLGSQNKARQRALEYCSIGKRQKRLEELLG